MDDIIAWGIKSQDLAVRVEQLAQELARWGLEINLSKYQYYCSPHATGDRQLVVMGHRLDSEDHLDVMGLCMGVNKTACETLAPLISKAQDSFWAIKHIVCRKQSLKKRLYIMNAIVGGCLSWCIGAIIPDGHALGLVSSMQLQFAVWVNHRGRKPGEEWLQRHIRVRREMRATLHRYQVQRWSARWLQMVWRYSGHRARGANNDVKVASVKIDEWRQLEWWLAEQNRTTRNMSQRQVFCQVDAPREGPQSGGRWSVENSGAEQRGMEAKRERVHQEHGCELDKWQTRQH